MSEPGTIVLYDADCGFCRVMLALLLRWDRQRRLRPVALQSDQAARLLGGMGEQERMASWHMATPDGRVRSAGPALAPLLRELPGGSGPAWLAERLAGPVDRAYRWVAANRTALSRRLISEGAKARADRVIERRR